MTKHTVFIGFVIPLQIKIKAKCLQRYQTYCRARSIAVGDQGKFGATWFDFVFSSDGLPSRARHKHILLEANQFFENFFIVGFRTMIPIGIRTKVIKLMKISCKIIEHTFETEVSHTVSLLKHRGDQGPVL